MRTKKINFNNIGQLRILNRLNEIERTPKNDYNCSTNKKSKIILLEKTSPYHYPVYVKFIKKINNGNSQNPERTINSYISREPINYSFVNDIHKNRNSTITEVSNSKINNNNNFSDTHSLNYKTNNKNENDINQLEHSLHATQKMEGSIVNTYLRNNRFISISPSHSSHKDDTKRKSNKNNKKIEIEVEENNENYNKNKNKHKMRLLLSKNYKGRKGTLRKFITKSPASIISDLNKKHIKINENKNNENDKYNLESTPGTLSNETDIINNKLQIRKNLTYRNPILKNTPLATMNTPYLQRIKNKGNIFLNISNNNNNYDLQIKLEDLIFLESRLNDIIVALNNKSNERDINVVNESVEFFSFYFNSSLQNKFPLFFSVQNRIIIKSAFNLNLFMVLIIYHLSLNPSMLIRVILLLRKIFEILKINLFLLIRKIEMYYGEEFCIKNEIYLKTFNYFLKENDLFDLGEKEIIEIINSNCVSITNDIENILLFYQTVNDKYFLDFHKIYMTISKIAEQDINDYFNNNLFNNNIEENENINQYTINTENNESINNEKNEILLQYNQDEEYLDKIILSYKKNRKIPPFIKSKSHKKYTLVLDLEDTLISVNIDNDGNVYCRKRPGLVSFLSGIKPFFEIITFTKLSKDYNNTIIKEIEGNNKLFDYNLYREHCVLVGREFIKDISKIGRDMKKVIMVDDLPDNLRYFPSNGILICPYNADENPEDRVLFELKKLLIVFFRSGYEDIRVALKRFKKEIYNKVTLGYEN
jgi:hypothetical protein